MNPGFPIWSRYSPPQNRRLASISPGADARNPKTKGELDERLGLEAIIAGHLSDSRHGLNSQFRLPDLLRQSIYSRLAGYEDLNDAARLSTDPTFRLIGSPKRWDRSCRARCATEP